MNSRAVALQTPVLIHEAVSSWLSGSLVVVTALAAALTFWVIEAIGIAADQWFGARADPSSNIASMSAVPAFAIFALVSLVPVWSHLRAIGPGSGTLVPRLPGRILGRPLRHNSELIRH